MRRVITALLLTCPVLLLVACSGSSDGDAKTSPSSGVRTPPPSMTPGALGPARTGQSVEAALATGLFRRAPDPCDRQRLDLVGGADGDPSLLLDPDGQRVALIRAGTAGRTPEGVGVGSTTKQLRAAYGDALLATEVTGDAAYYKVVDGRAVLQLNVRDDVVRTMYTYDVRDWDNLAPGSPAAPQVYLDGLGGRC